ncbi:MAG: sodium/glutamate symporter [Planctomycetota bacterium]
MLIALILACLLLAMGFIARMSLPWFSAAKIPASLIGGLLGLVAIQAWVQLASSPMWLEQTLAQFRQWPGTLIAIVFAGMLLSRRPTDRSWKTKISHVGKQGLMVWIIVLGQTAVGMMMTWLIIQPAFELPNSVGFLIETGFAGGHGTAAAMGVVFSNPKIGFPAGLDIGLLMATCGLIYGLIGGVIWVNVGLSRRWFVETNEAANQTESTSATITPASSHVTASGESSIDDDAIDRYLLQLVWLIVAVGVGMLIQLGVNQVGLMLDRSISGLVESFPLFIYTLAGGGVLAWTFRLAGISHWVEPELITRWIGTAMDLLVVAAVASLNLQAVSALWFPFAVLFVAGSIWSTFCLLVLSRMILPRHIWFPLALINFGMSTGVTATGFVLLRMVDPKLRSGSAEDYALAAPLSAPFIGGGILTIGLPLLVIENVSAAISALVFLILVVVLIVIGYRWNRQSG